MATNILYNRCQKCSCRWRFVFWHLDISITNRLRKEYYCNWTTIDWNLQVSQKKSTDNKTFGMGKFAVWKKKSENQKYPFKKCCIIYAHDGTEYDSKRKIMHKDHWISNQWRTFFKISKAKFKSYQYKSSFTRRTRLVAFEPHSITKKLHWARDLNLKIYYKKICQNATEHKH